MKASKITAIDFWDDLTSGYARKRFFAAFTALSVAAVTITWFAETILPEGTAKTILSSVSVELAVGFIIVLLFYLVYMFLIGPNVALRSVNVTRPQDISERMAELPKGVRNYLFWGRSGSFFRARPLLAMDAEAKTHRRATSIEVLLPDPADRRLIESYKAIRHALDEDADEDNPLLPNIIATCITCAIISANNNQIDIKIHLSSFLPAFRIDLSDNGAILTQDDPNKSALFFETNYEFYYMFRSMAKNERDMSKRIDWDRALFVGLKLDASSCTVETLSAFGIEVHREATRSGKTLDYGNASQIQMKEISIALNLLNQFTVHPLGFFYLKSAELESNKRVHVWLPDLSSADNDRHTHSFSLHSTLLSGRMQNEIFEFKEIQDGDEKEYEVTYSQNTSKLHETGRRALTSCSDL